MGRYLEQDIDYLVEHMQHLSELNGKNILVTGATGLLGSFITKTLCRYSKVNNASIHVIAVVRNEQKASLVFRDYLYDGILSFVISNLNRSIETDLRVDYIIHGASITSSKLFVQKPVETIQTLVDGTKIVLDLAREKEVANTLFLSSLEVYGIPEINRYLVDEEYVGYIDYTNVRSSYSEGKRMAECLCYSYANEYGIKVTTARLSQTFGPGVACDDGRVFAQFSRAVINQQNIELNTRGRTHRNYCYLRDAVAGIFYILVRGKNCEAYNIANKTTGISIVDMAKLICESPKLGNGQINVIFNRGEQVGRYGYNPEMKIELLTNKLEQLGWRAEVGLEDMFFRMIEDMKDDMQRCQ